MPVIVIESPNKIKKIRQFTGATVVATVGHFQDLPGDELAVDLQSYQPTFKTSSGKADVVSKLKSACKGEDVIIATDPDREGYAIGTMVYDLVKGSAKSIKRAEIHEITEKGVKSALAAAVPWDKTNKGLYSAFLGRRVVDRLVGYILSPLANKALNGKYSVGRVQSPAARLVVDREREIKNFKPDPYFTLSVTLHKGLDFTAEHTGGRIADKAKGDALLAKVQGAPTAKVLKVEKKEVKTNPKAPFTTVEMQASASSQLGISPEKSMKLAQELFEAGIISYHRSDSVRIADEFIDEIRDYVKKDLGPAFLPAKPNVHKSKNSQADAHEAIRPTHMHRPSETGKLIADAGLSAEHTKLYTLIYNRAVASQLLPAVFDATTVTFDCAGEEFRATGRVQTFPGWMAVYAEQAEDPKDDEEKDQSLPALSVGEEVKKNGAALAAKETKPPPRYSEATLVKALEKLGIGRPSTYASIISTIKARAYVKIVKGRLHAESSGEAVIDYLLAQHPWIIDYNMTKTMEEYLDKVEHGEAGATWQIFCKGVHAKMGFAAPSQRGADGVPSEKAIQYAKDLAAKQGLTLPADVETSVRACRAWLDKHAPKKAGSGSGGSSGSSAAGWKSGKPGKRTPRKKAA